MTNVYCDLLPPFEFCPQTFKSFWETTTDMTSSGLCR